MHDTVKHQVYLDNEQLKCVNVGGDEFDEYYSKVAASCTGDGRRDY